MADFLRRHSVVITSFLLLICSFQLMSASIQNPSLPRAGGHLLNSALSPVQELHHSFVRTGADLWNHYFWLVDVQSEHSELLSRIKALEAQNSRLLEFESENARLRSLLNFREQTGLDGLAATVIGRDPSNWIRTVTIDRGADDGVKSGLPVVDGHAIVGQTTVVSAHSAKVLLLTDSRSAIDAIVQSSRSPGIIEGTSTDLLRLRYVLKEHEVAAGDRIIASGLDGVYPKGALIGVVTTVATQPDHMFHNIEVLPSVDVGRLENVLVITSQVTQHPSEKK